jgi:D-alanyl-D-alanine carboxypeptidase
MKPTKKRIYQKKKQRKFKNIKHQKITSTATVQSDPNETTLSKPKKVSVSLASFHKFFTLRLKFPKKEEKNKSEKNFSGHHFEWFKKHDSDMQLILFPLILAVILCIMSIYNNQLSASMPKQESISAVPSTVLNPYPYVQAADLPIISAKTAIILDRGSQVILYSKNPQLRFSMASTTKIMTALVALDYYKLDDVLTVETGNVPGSGLNLIPGEKFHFDDLLYAMLLPSANDAAQAIADNYPGGVGAFVTKMNEKAQSLHLTNTHYADPIGLNDDGDYSTVVDMARLASSAMANSTFVGITSTKYKTIYSTNLSRQYVLTNLNRLLGIDGVTGIKTGTTEGAGEVLVTSVVKNGHEYVIVVMDSEDRFADTSLLLNFIDNNVKYVIPPTPAK